MALWSIGSIRGQFQPESFTETQNTKLEDIDIFGQTSFILHKGWDPREITISFVVDGMCDPAESDEQWNRPKDVTQRISQRSPIEKEPRAADPEEVWEEIQRMQRPPNGNAPELVPVIIPGWLDFTRQSASTVNVPRQAVISSSSINRTHVAGLKSRAVRAIITVTLREVPRFIAGDRSGLTSAARIRTAQDRLGEAARREATAGA